MNSDKFSKRLESDAHDLVYILKKKDGNSTTTSFGRNIEFTLEQLDNLRETHKSQLRELLRTECYVGTGLLRFKDLAYKGHAVPHQEKGKLYDRLFEIEKEKRHLDTLYQDKLSRLQGRLLDLIQKSESVYG